MKKIEAPKMDHDTYINNELLTGEIELTLSTISAEVKIKAHNYEHLRYVKKLLNELVK